MKFKVNKSKCAGCGACLRACPHGAIRMGEDGKAFIDQKRCQKCGTCQEICPFNAIEKISDEKGTEQFKKQETSLSSSSPPVRESSSYGPSPTGGKELGERRDPDWSRGMGRKRKLRRGRG